METQVDDTVMPAPEPFDAKAVGAKMAQETAVFELHMRRPGFRRPISSEEFIRKIREAGEQQMTPEQEQKLAQYRASIVTSETEEGETTDTTMIHVSQDILDYSQIANIAYHDGKFSQWVKRHAIPSPMLAPGLFQIRLSRIEEIDAALANYLAARKVRIEAFRDKYNALKEEAKVTRYPFFNESDYPAWSVIEAKYKVDWQYLTFNVPAALESINSQIYKTQQEKYATKWADAAEMARDGLRVAIMELFKSTTDMLGKDETGKRKTFRPKAIEKLLEFLKMFDEVNITGDAELEKFVAMTRDLLSGVDPASLKKDLDLRDHLLASVSAISEQVAPLVTVRERKVVFDDEPESGNPLESLLPPILEVELTEDSLEV